MECEREQGQKDGEWLREMEHLCEGKLAHWDDGDGKEEKEGETAGDSMVVIKAANYKNKRLP